MSTKDSLSGQIENSGEKVSFLVVPPDVFGDIMNEFNEMAIRSESETLKFMGHPLLGVNVVCDKDCKAVGKDILGIFLDDKKHPTRMIMRTEATAKLIS